MQFKDYYETLGVSKSASEADIQKAYRKLARKFHPDVNKDPSAETRFKEIGEAYEVLKDSEKRKKYDRYGSAWKTAQQTGSTPPGWEGFDFGGAGRAPQGADFEFGFGDSGFSSFFEMLFGESARGGRGNPAWNTRGGGPSPAAPGRDRESRLALSLEDLAHGGKRTLELADPLTGTAQRIEVNIPAGVRPGQKIRLAGKGEPGRGGANGDLFLMLEALPHDRFKLEKGDLHTEVDITPAQAALGAEVEVPTLSGTVSIRIPPGSSSGRQLRLRGKGMPSRSGNGDLFASLRIVLPKELSEEERKIYQQLSDLADGETREPLAS